MDQLRKYLGIIWMLLGPATIIALLVGAFRNINSEAKGDISNPVPWIIIIAIFTPIAIGFSVFGWYCWKGEYNTIGEED